MSTVGLEQVRIYFAPAANKSVYLISAFLDHSAEFSCRWLRVLFEQSPVTRTVSQASGCDVMNCVSRSYTCAIEESIGRPCNGVIKTHNTRLHAVQMTTRCTYRGRDGCANDEGVLKGFR